MTWEIFYFICFLVGFLLSLTGFLTGAAHFHIPHIGHLHAGARGHVHSGGRSSWFNFGTVTTFLAWFGGVGFLLSKYSAMWAMLALGIAILSGIGGASVVFWFVLRYLMSGEKPMNPADYDMIGVLGHVTSTVRSGGVGEMLFSQDGSRRAVPIRSDSGGAIARDTEVVVIRYEKGIAYVQPWDELSNTSFGPRQGQSDSIN